MSLFTLVLISWALEEGHLETLEQQAGQICKSVVAPCILSVHLGFESCRQADTRADKTSNGASDLTFPHLQGLQH